MFFGFFFSPSVAVSFAWQPSHIWHESPFPALPLISKAKSAFLPSESPGFQTRRCQFWRAQSWGWSSSSRCSWTSVTGRAREAGRASTSWSMSLRGALKSSLLTLPHMGSKPSRWMSEDQRTERRMQCFLSWSRMFFLHTGVVFVISGRRRPNL